MMENKNTNDAVGENDYSPPQNQNVATTPYLRAKSKANKFSVNAGHGGTVEDLGNNRWIAKATLQHHKFLRWKDGYGDDSNTISCNNPLDVSGLSGLIVAEFYVQVLSVTVDDSSACVEGTRIEGTDNFVFGTWVTVKVKNGVSGNLYEGDINRGRSYTFLILVDRIFTVK